MDFPGTLYSHLWKFKTQNPINMNCLSSTMFFDAYMYVDYVKNKQIAFSVGHLNSQWKKRRMLRL